MFERLEAFLTSQVKARNVLSSIAKEVLGTASQPDPEVFMDLWKHNAKYLFEMVLLYPDYYGALCNRQTGSNQRGEWHRFFVSRVDSAYTDHKLQIKVFKSILSLKIKLSEPLQIIDYLLCLSLYYGIIARNMPLEVTVRVDAGMARVVALAVEIFEGGKLRSAREKGRAKMTARKKAKKSFVYEIFSDEFKNLRRDMSLNGVATSIEKKFRQRQDKGLIPSELKRPSSHQIRKYLIENDEIMRRFERRGKRYLLQT